MDPSSSGIIFASIVTVLFGIVGYAFSRRRREIQDTTAYKIAVEQELHIPPTLHPIIDPKRCMGSLSCLAACPEGDILGIVDGKAALIEGSNCIGHGRCAMECPVDAIKLVFGTSERGVDLPEIDEFFETGRPGVHIVGELGGMGLIKNAMTQGLQVADRLSTILEPSGGRRGSVDVLIVGAGPAGLATALGCKKHKISFQLIDQERVGGTVANYPRQKLVMVDKVDLPFYGKFGALEISKEELLRSFAKMTKLLGGDVKTGTKIEGIAGSDGHFTVKTNRGDFSAKKVVLATGRRGTPRKLNVPGEDLEKVTYNLTDPDQYNGKRVLVVGGGDSALEAAIMLADQGNILVSISYRNPAFGRCRPANRDRIAELIAGDRVQAIFNSQVTAVEEKKVRLKVGDVSRDLPNDYVIVCIGGELPVEFLKSVGVEVKRHFGTAPERRKSRNISRITRNELAEQRKRKSAAYLYIVVGALIIFGLAWVGRNYYLLPKAERVRSSLHASLRPGGLWGHGIGIIATLVMLSNFLYAARKRWRWMKGRAPIKSWLTFHMFVGFMSPLVIVFHAAFQSNNLFATMTFAALLVVVSTGVVGRFIYGLLPYSGDKLLEMSELLSRFEQHKAVVGAERDMFKGSKSLVKLMRWMSAPVDQNVSLSALMLRWPVDYLKVRKGLFFARFGFERRKQYTAFRDELFTLLRLRRQVSAYRMIRRILSVWRMLHVTLAIFLLVLIGIHIYTTTYYGYRWIF